MKNLQKPRFFENLENSENYTFAIKEKAAFRYADRKKKLKQLKKWKILWAPRPETKKTEIPVSVPGRSRPSGRNP